MSRRALSWLLGALAVLGVAYGIVALASSGGEGPDGGELARAFRAVDRDRVDRIRFLQPGDTVVLNREGDRWYVEGYPADSAAMRRFWEYIEEPDVGGVVSRNPANHRRMAVTDSMGVILAFDAGEETLARILVGESGPTYPSVYARLPDADAVHVVGAGLRGPSMRGPRGWRDKTIVSVDTAAVQRLEVDRPDGSYALVRESGEWRLDGEPARAEAVRGILGQLGPLASSGFAPDTASFPGEGREVHALAAHGESGEPLVRLRVSRGGSGPAWVTTPGKEPVFTLQGWKADRLVPPRQRVATDGS